MQRILASIDAERAHMTCFTVSRLERQLAVRLGIPLYGVDPNLLDLGTKSGSRRTFREAGVSTPLGTENVRTEAQVAEAVADIWEESEDTRRVVVKKDHGFSGEGNAVLDLSPLTEVAPAASSRGGRVNRIIEELPKMRFAAFGATWATFREELAEMGGVVEQFIEGEETRSPSGQLRINPRSELECVSTHDQLLGGPDGQTYVGARFPAADAYRMEIQADALRVGEVLVDKGVVGRVAVDFMAVRRGGEWKRYAIEINLRMSGTTHPLMIMRMLNAGRYDQANGLYLSGHGQPRSYVCTDTLSAPTYRGLSVEDVLDIAAVHGLHYRPWTDDGVVFHLLGAVSQHGKLGVTAYAASPDAADALMRRTADVLDEETAG
jgi:hypothetical protein